MVQNSGNPDYRKIRGFGGVVVRNFSNNLTKIRKDSSSKVVESNLFSNINDISTELNKLQKQIDTFLITKRKIRNLYSLLSSSKFLIKCYRKINSRKDNISTINLNQLNNLSKKLKIGFYQFKKQTNNSYSLEDQIIFEGLKQLIIIIFFKQLKHKNYQETFNKIYTKMHSAKWFIRGNFSKYFMKKNKMFLISKIKNIIEDQYFIDLFCKALEIELINYCYYKSDLKNVSMNFLLINIILYDFDLSIKKFLFKLKMRKYKIDKKYFNQIEYVRYNDSFFISVIGSEKDCFIIQKQIYSILKESFICDLNLINLSINKSTSRNVFFLGYNIYINKNKDSSLIPKNYIVLNISIDKIIKELAFLGYCKFNGNPTCCNKLIHKSLCELIKIYSSFERNLFKIHFLASNYKEFTLKVHYILKYSCALTFASKLRLNTLKKVFKKFGKNLSVYDKNLVKICSYPKLNELL